MRKRERTVAESREEGRGELISSTHAHGAALRVPRDSPGIPHNIPSFPLIPRRTHRVCPPDPPLPPIALFTSSAASAWSQLYRPALQDFPASQRGVKIKTARCDYFTLIILHCVPCHYKSETRRDTKCTESLYLNCVFFLHFVFHLFSIKNLDCTLYMLFKISSFLSFM